MSPHRLAILHKRILFAFFATVGVLVFLTLDFGSSHRAASAAHDASMGDQLSPGFFNPPPGVQPINNVLPSRIPHARRSYAWRSHGNKRELVAFSTPIQHVVVIYMENRTPENLFGAWYGTTNPSTGNTFGTDLKLEDVSLVSPNAYFSPEPLTHGKDPAHNHNAAFVDEAAGSWPTAGDKSGYWYVPTSGASPSVSNYIALIENWAYENSTLESNEGPSFVAHQYAIAGQSGGLSNSNIAPNGMSENPAGGTGPDPGPGLASPARVRLRWLSICTRPIRIHRLLPLAIHLRHAWNIVPFSMKWPRPPLPVRRTTNGNTSHSMTGSSGRRR